MEVRSKPLVAGVVILDIIVVVSVLVAVVVDIPNMTYVVGWTSKANHFLPVPEAKMVDAALEDLRSMLYVCGVGRRLPPTHAKVTVIGQDVVGKLQVISPRQAVAVEVVEVKLVGSLVEDQRDLIPRLVFQPEVGQPDGAAPRYRHLCILEYLYACDLCSRVVQPSLSWVGSGNAGWSTTENGRLFPCQYCSRSSPH